MPKKLHSKLEKQASKMGLTGKKKDAYVYGTMQKAEKKKSMMNREG